MQNDDLILKLDEMNSTITSLTNQVIILSADYQEANRENKRLVSEICRMCSSVDDLKKENSENLKSLNDSIKVMDKLNKQIEQLTLENEKLRNQNNRDSGNSSKPSSSNPYRKIYNSRKKTDKKAGAQNGHKGHTLELRTPDIIEEYRDKVCALCGNFLHCDENDYITKQIIDIEVKTIVKEVRMYKTMCPVCGASGYSSSSYRGNSKVEYGNVLKSLTTVLRDIGHISTNRLTNIIKGMTGGIISVSEGTIINMSNKLGKLVEPMMEKTKELLVKSKIMHVDETGMRINGKIFWIHTYSLNDTTYYQVHQSRGDKSIEDADILNDYEGILISDHFSMYFKYGKDRGECNAHILRYLESAIQNYKRVWPSKMKEFLLTVKKEKTRLLENDIGSFTQERLNEIESQYNAILEAGNVEFKQDIDIHKDFNGEDMKLLRRMTDCKHNHLLYAYDFRVPFTNNLAERDLRVFKSRLKVSGCFRSLESAQMYMNLMGFLSTLKKRGINSFDAIKNVYENGIESVKGLEDIFS